jgi:hypothetical protein
LHEIIFKVEDIMPLVENQSVDGRNSEQIWGFSNKTNDIKRHEI